MGHLRRILDDGGGSNLLLNFIQRDLARRKLTGDADLVITRPGPFLTGEYDAVDVSIEDRRFRVTVKEVK